MKRSRFSDEQIIGILKERQAGLSAVELCRKYGVSDATFYKWRSKYGGMEIAEANRLKAVEDENGRLKRLLAEAMLDVSKRVLAQPFILAAEAIGVSPSTMLVSTPAAQYPAAAEKLYRQPVRRRGHRICLARLHWSGGRPLASRLGRNAVRVSHVHFRRSIADPVANAGAGNDRLPFPAGR